MHKLYLNVQTHSRPIRLSMFVLTVTCKADYWLH